jgi:hypothetical protein
MNDRGDIIFVMVYVKIIYKAKKTIMADSTQLKFSSFGIAKIRVFETLSLHIKCAIPRKKRFIASQFQKLLAYSADVNSPHYHESFNWQHPDVTQKTATVINLQIYMIWNRWLKDKINDLSSRVNEEKGIKMEKRATQGTRTPDPRITNALLYQLS